MYIFNERQYFFSLFVQRLAGIEGVTKATVGLLVYLLKLGAASIRVYIYTCSAAG